MRRRGWRRVTMASTVAVNLKSGGMIRGTLTEELEDLIVLERAELFVEGAPSPTPLDGRTIIDVDNIAFAQATTP